MISRDAVNLKAGCLPQISLCGLEKLMVIYFSTCRCGQRVVIAIQPLRDSLLGALRMSSAAKKKSAFYAVRRGRVPGVYNRQVNKLI